jgi:outer membrane protein OmpA-like peptidoglycan-associated protein
MTFRIRAALAAALLSLTGAAQAQGIDFNLERLRLDPSARGSLVMGSGEVLAPEGVRLSATMHYERTPLVLLDTGELRGRGIGATGDSAEVVTSRSTVHLGAAFGLGEHWELGLEVPVVVDQSTEVGGLGGNGIAAPWFQLRYGTEAMEHVAAAASVAVSPSWGNGTRFNGNLGWSIVPGVELGFKLGRSIVMANVAGLLRTEDVVLTKGETLSHEILAAVGWATTGRPLRFEISAHGAFDTSGLDQSAELLAGLRYALGPAELFVLGGPGFLELPGTPSFRGLAGIALDVGGRKAEPKKAPPPVVAAQKAVDVCAPGQKHAPEQCPDADDDGDGIANGADACPLVKGIAATKGCPPTDSDGDGVPDHEDKCPQQKGDAANGGCPPADSDGDGVPDAEDKCPQQAGVPANGGCPPARAAINVETKKIEIKEKVYFDSGKSTIQQRSNALLDDVAALLIANPKAGNVTIEGHTDDRGPAELNRTLSKARADAVKAYLVQKGVPADRLATAGFGPDRPAQPNTTAAGREANRRVEFILK